MKQILQNIRSGETTIVQAPAPMATPRHLIVHTTRSLISAGTERMLVEFGKASWIDKARQQPEKVRMVLDKIRTDGLLTTLEAVNSKLDEPLPLGYCNVGVVADIGTGVTSFRRGDRVVSNGPHADVVRVGQNLCARIPDAVDDDSAAFVILASIGLQGVRLAAPTLGESFVVMGAGLIGLLTIQILRAHGCRVLAFDFDDVKLELARQFGAVTCKLSEGSDPVETGIAFSRGRGVDGVIIAASTTSSDPISHAAKMSRKRGRIVLVGVTGLELNRSDFYTKELSFQVSCSYGPGRYEPEYEEQGQDYPVGYVRWTEQRNFEAVLEMLAEGLIDARPLITHRYAFEEAPAAYAQLTESRSTLGILLTYSSPAVEREVRNMPLNGTQVYDTVRPVLGFIGAGNYASRMLIPAFKRAGAQFHTIVTLSGVSGVIHGKKAGFARASTDIVGLWTDSEINTVVISTRHDSHASLAAKALRAGKHIFVEKPLAINPCELIELQTAYDQAIANGRRLQLMVGFNRRFAPQTLKMKTLLAAVSEPKSFIMTINAGAIPSTHWVQDNFVGGGRIIGEACHFIDLMRFLAGSPIVSAQARRMGDVTGVESVHDKASITLSFADGSFGTIMYLANGASSFSKERIEVFAAGRVLQLDNFRKMRGYGWPGFDKYNLWKQDKGQQACAAAFLLSLQQGTPAIPLEEIFEVARITLEIDQTLRQQ